MKLLQLMAVLTAGLAVFLSVLLPPLLPDGAGAMAGLMILLLACALGLVGMAPLGAVPVRVRRMWRRPRP